MAAGGNIWLNPQSANHSNIKKKQKKKHRAIWKNTDTRLQPDLFFLLHLNSRMNGKCQGIGFPKPQRPVSHEVTKLFWCVHAVWSDNVECHWTHFTGFTFFFFLFFLLLSDNFPGYQAGSSEILTWPIRSDFEAVIALCLWRPHTCDSRLMIQGSRSWKPHKWGNGWQRK